MSDLGNRTNVNAAIDLLLDDAQPNEAIQPSDHNGLLKDILDTLANGLSVTLRTGNTTSGQNIEVTSGDTIDFDNSSFLGSLTSGTLTAARTYTLPDKTGTVAMLSDVENILNTNGLILGGNYTHDLNSNNLGMFGGSVGIGDDLSVISSDATKTYLANFVSSSSNAVLTMRNDFENVGIGDSAPDSSAKLEISSTDSGLLIPRMSTTQRNAIGSPLESLMIYNTTDDQFEFYDSLGAWSQLGGGGASIYTADGTVSAARLVDLDNNKLTFDIGTLASGSSNTIGIRIDGSNIFYGGGSGSSPLFEVDSDLGNVLNVNSGGYLISTSDYTNVIAQFKNRAGTKGLHLKEVVTDIACTQFRHLFTNSDTSDRIDQAVTSSYQQWLMAKNNDINHWIRNGDSAAQASFFINGVTGRGFNVGAGFPIGSEDISLQGSTLIKGNGTTTGTTLALYDNDTIPNLNWEWLDNGGLTGYNSKTSLIAQNATSNDINEYIFRLRNSADTGNYFFVGNGGEVRLGKQATDNSTGDKSTNNLWGEIVTKSGSGGYATLIGGNITANYTGERVVGLGRYITITKERTVGIGGSVTISGDYSNGIGNTVTLGQFSHGVGTFITSSSTKNNLFGSFLDVTAQGAGVWGYGVNTANDLVNSTADSLALGWNSTTPQHLFFQTGAYIGGNSAIGTEDISLQGDVLMNANVNMANIPTSSAGLSAGDIWNDGGTLKIV